MSYGDFEVCEECVFGAEGPSDVCEECDLGDCFMPAMSDHSKPKKISFKTLEAA